MHYICYYDAPASEFYFLLWWKSSSSWLALGVTRLLRLWLEKVIFGCYLLSCLCSIAAAAIIVVPDTLFKRNIREDRRRENGKEKLLMVWCKSYYYTFWAITQTQCTPECPNDAAHCCEAPLPDKRTSDGGAHALSDNEDNKSGIFM